MRSSTSSPLTFGSFRSSNTTAGMSDRSRPSYWPVPNRNSSASLPSRVMTISFASLEALSARIVSASSSGLSSTSRIIFSGMEPPELVDRRERPLRERAEQRCRRTRPRKQVALALVARMLAQEIKLPDGFDTLGQHPQAERVRERNDGLRDRSVAAARDRLHDERAVDLKAVDRKSRQIAQARFF